MVGKGEIKFSTYERATGLITSRFQKVKQQVDAMAALGDPLTPVQIRTLSTYLAEIKRKRSDYEGNLLRILESATIEEAPQATLSTDQDQINDLFVYISSVIETLLPVPEPTSPSASSESAFAHTLVPAQVRLPKLELQHFNGDPNQWVSFINLFDTSVHRNASVSNVAKFQYLLSVLSGEPLMLIKSLNITTANYLVAYELLRERYHNTRRLQALHLNNLLDLPQVSASSPKIIRAFLNQYLEHTQALKALDCDIVTASNPLFSIVLLRKMDSELRKKLENYRVSQDLVPHTLPGVQDIAKFLTQECSLIEDSSLHLPQCSTKASHSQPSSHRGGTSRVFTQPKTNSQNKQVSMLSTQTNIENAIKPPCFACEQPGHKVYTCPIFQAKSPSERYRLVKSKQRCNSCLGSHPFSQCNSKASCFKCKNRHHTLLHFENKDNIKSPENANHSHSTENNTVTVTSAHGICHSVMEATSTVLLGTTLVQLSAPNGNSQVFRALLDSGSMCDFLSERAAQYLGVTRRKSTLSIQGIAQTTSQTKGCTDLLLSSLNGNVVAYKHTFHILDRISTDLPRTQISAEVLRKVRPYVLADPTFHIPCGIDVLIGGALFPQIFTKEVHPLGPNLPSVVGTIFGYIVMGQAPCLSQISTSLHCASLHATVNDFDLNSSMQRFWQQEEPPACNSRTAEEVQCDEHFVNSHSRDSTGRYVVRLPFKADHLPLGNSRHTAEKRLYSLERNLMAHPHISHLYREFIDEYRSLNHMVKCEDLDPCSPHYFLPHHGVLKESSSTTKLRTVFDASSKTSTGVSLNDILLTGPKLQTNICDVLTQFRCHNTVFSCDIRQMYRQILVHPADRKYQLILWRDSTQEPISTYQLNTVTYGLNTSPYLAIRTLHQLAEDEGASFPAAAQVLKKNTYVDDIISGADTEEEALELQDQLIQLLRCGGFELRKWVSSSSRLLQDLPEGHLETPVFLQESQQPQFSILGLHWSPGTDCFSYNINFPQDTSPTKRSVLSVIAKIYDPCGFLSPCIMQAKCFMQLLWTKGLNWDEPLPQDLAAKWRTFVSHARALVDIHIPRAFQISISCAVELHGFSDASESGYAAVVYVRCELGNGECVVRQVISKTRVAPLRKVTLPRLELCAAHLLGQIVAHCINIFSDKVTFKTTVLWCDSSVVLTWLRTPPYKLKTYVANRVAQTQEIAPSTCWRHISSSDNPADCASRGILGSELKNHSLWWTGPAWLRLPPPQWPVPQFHPVDLSSGEETKTTSLNVLIATRQEEWALFSQFSSWTRLQYVVGYILRFIFNCRHLDKKTGHLTVQELKTARLRIFACVQQLHFREDIDRLTSSRPCSTRLQRLAPFLDPDGLLRVGGRLKFSSLDEDARHPIILPKTHPVVNLLIDHTHLSHLHSGPQLTQALLARSVWILSARSAVRTRIFKCVRCFRNKPRNRAPLMGDLPGPRVTLARPFSSTGMDYCGAFNVKMHNLRGMRQLKVYLCIFVCMVTKAVHIEVVTDLTTEAFIAALTRFVSRRGLCSHVYSDCGTNFVGADTLLRKVLYSLLLAHDAQQQIHSFTTPRGIQFHFNTPSSPHQGGLWEGAVKSAKHHLRRVMGDTVLTLPEFITLSTQVEAMLNSRPLTQSSSDPSDVNALTPGHFLIGAPLAAVPEPELLDIAVNRLKRWQLVQAFHQRIWHRWSLEYLHTLQQRVKWTTSIRNLQVGDLVLIHCATPPLTWPLARIIAIHPGADGVVRTVTLKTQGGTLKRPAVKVFPLP